MGNGTSHPGDALGAQYAIISVMGPHAGESEEFIFERKIKEVSDAGRSFWVHRSSNAKPERVKALCRKAGAEGRPVYCVFIEPSSRGGAQPTSEGQLATRYSADGGSWLPVPEGIRPTGNISRGATAMVFDAIEMVNGRIEIDLWDYSDFGFPGKALPVRQGGSTLCVERHPSLGDPARLKSHRRRVVAVARMADPFAVWLR